MQTSQGILSGAIRLGEIPMEVTVNAAPNTYDRKLRLSTNNSLYLKNIQDIVSVKDERSRTVCLRFCGTVVFHNHPK